MLSAIDQMFDELAKRDDSFEVTTVVLSNSDKLPLEVRSHTWRTVPCTDALAVSVILPLWTRGWSDKIQDEDARNTLTLFLSYARQYILRSYLAKILMIAWEHERRVLHPFGDQAITQYFWHDTSKFSATATLNAAQVEAQSRWGAVATPIAKNSTWKTANTFDPCIHQAIFHFLRGHDLLASKFELEAVVAFDCALQSLKGLLIRAGLATSATTRGQLCQLLGVGPRTAAVADSGYFLRNNFGAHAGGWRWWDHDELTKEIAPALAHLTKRALGKSSLLEAAHRDVDANAKGWSAWLLGNFSSLWTAIWFDKLHQR